MPLFALPHLVGPRLCPTRGLLAEDRVSRFQTRAGRTNASVRLAADGVGLVAGLLGGIITARYLGPDGKGVFAVITYLVGIVAMISTLGIGEAEIFFVNRGQHELRAAIDSSLAAVLATGSIGGLLLVGVLTVYVSAGEVGWVVIALAGATVPASALANTVAHLHNILERFVFTSGLAAGMSACSALLTWILVGPLQRGVTGAILAALVVAVLGAAVGLGLLGRVGEVGPRWSYFRRSSRFGTSLVAAGVLMSLAGRADLLVVGAVLGSASAGFYSVALTVAALPTYGASAIAFVAFPRLSRDDNEPGGLVSRLSRLGILSAVVGAIGLAPLVPFLVPTLFGQPFREAVPATLVLLSAAPLWALHLVLGRAAAAAGRPQLLSTSYLASLAAMIVLDAVLIPPFALLGAGIASAVAPLAGLAFLIRWHTTGGGHVRTLVPRFSDARDIASRRQVHRLDAGDR